MSTPAATAPTSANLSATPILDYHDGTIRDIAANLRERNPEDRKLLQSAHRYIADSVKPVYSLDELQPASHTLRKQRGSCSQRMACLEAVVRACDVATRARVLRISGRFWYPRFRVFRAFIPRRILLVWPQFFLEESWVDFDELYSPAAELAEVFARFGSFHTTLRGRLFEVIYGGRASFSPSSP